MVAKIRRVVTGVNGEGRSIVLFDGMAENVLLLPSMPGAAITELWVTGEMPVDNSGDRDRGTRPFKHDPDPHGTIFRIVELPPEKELGAADDSKAAMDKAMDALGSRHKTTSKERTRHPTMHMTDSVDYLVILSGEVTMVMDEGEITLNPGDCIVQRGTRHGWANRGDKPVIIFAALIDAKHVEGH